MRSPGITVVATFGKFVGSALTARAMGIDWTSSVILGALMNTRGLMELIALNVGYDLGVILRDSHIPRRDGARHYGAHGPMVDLAMVWRPNQIALAPAVQASEGSGGG